MLPIVWIDILVQQSHKWEQKSRINLNFLLMDFFTSYVACFLFEVDEYTEELHLLYGIESAILQT